MYQRQQVQQLGQEVYHELDGDGLPPLPGVLDDPVFAQLPPPPADRPVSWGRYQPPAATTAAATLPQEAQEAGPAAGSQTTGKSGPPQQEETEEEEPEQAETEQQETGEKQVAGSQAARSQAAGSQTTGRQGTSPVSPTGESLAAPAQQRPAADPAAPQKQAPASSGPVQAVTPPAAPSSFTERLKTRARLHILLIGNDEPELGTGRGDVLVVLTFDPVAQQLTFLSVPRDTRVRIPERDGQAKINAAYALGGPTLQTLAVEHFLGLPMDKFVEVSMNGFQRVIDLVGGVEVSPPFAFELDGQQFQPGRVQLNGEQALAYIRMRKQDPRGDLGRNERQQEVIRSLMASLAQRSPEELNALLQQLSTQVRTNFSPSEVVALRRTHAYAVDHQSVLRPAGENRRIDGQWYYVVSDRERQRLHLALR
ncbi:cell envelope-related transcriptional attenuator (plasmid) [Deinococcus proteolyticus MRP]|uniref:Cell envelope-related transcriptional attenuator n=1 Tax=Deinococcus proteolyticus (strain ATCC 35074 / DSM 20540 / JCM 6276 / NBRC 101906 / NCIMB 13154 / VKM Ac-1939 / CCM 2703 / MRP) TaxID=693977 RepID=F0RQX9_DEIPM|nr:MULTISPECIES: LCP family protein [Deinococcus]ADY27688.1 cell envelope-related transcriptional attenuator [Deinococcus proteolyticus MRP]MCY1703451.1 LCP family protein [Deinococcus sp. SL84]